MAQLARTSSFLVPEKRFEVHTPTQKVMQPQQTLSSPVTGRSKPKLGHQSDSSDRPDLAVKMDYSNTYRENDELNDVLEDKLDDIHKDQYRMWSEKSEQLKQIRRQVQVIVRLRQAVNSRKPGDSIDIVTRARPRRYSRQQSTVKADEKPVDSIDVDEIAKATKTQMRINQEREKFSSKNLFNVLRKGNGFGSACNLTGSGTNTASSGNNTNNTNNANRLFAPRKSISGVPMNSTSVSKGGMDRATDGSTKVAVRQRPETAHVLRGYRRDTLSSIHGNRPRTAMEKSRSLGALDHVEDDPLPPKSGSARRSRSRRELELLCRMYSDMDESSIEVDDVPQWEVIRENQRKQKLLQLQSQRQHLEVRVQRFLSEIEKFNSPPKKKSQSYLVLYDDDQSY